MRKILVFILSIACATALLGQTPSSADAQFKAGKYAEAQKSYKALIKSYPSNALFLYRYARCAQELGDDSTAIKYFIKSGDRYNLKHLYLGDSYLRLWKADKALESYQTYQQKEPEERHAYVKKQIAHAELLQRYLRRVERLQVIDSMEVPLESMLDVVQLSAEAGKLTLSATNSVTYTNQRNDRMILAVRYKSKRILVSSHRLLDSWSSYDTLPDNINFAKDHCSPYLLSDGVTLYFAAQDEHGIGGLDIYVSRYNTATESYTTPENIGLPYNSPANEYMFVVDEVRQIGFLATDRFARKGHVHVYSFAIPEQKKYWRDIASESLVAYARLEHFEKYTEELIEVHHKIENIDETDDFSFIINDSIIYYSIEEFQQPTARDKYHEWKDAEQQYLSEQAQLAELREAYIIADDDTKKELTPTILRLENNQSQLLKRCQNLLSEIRAIELKAR